MDNASAPPPPAAPSTSGVGMPPPPPVQGSSLPPSTAVGGTPAAAQRPVVEEHVVAAPVSSSEPSQEQVLSPTVAPSPVEDIPAPSAPAPQQSADLIATSASNAATDAAGGKLLNAQPVAETVSSQMQQSAPSEGLPVTPNSAPSSTPVPATPSDLTPTPVPTPTQQPPQNPQPAADPSANAPVAANTSPSPPKKGSSKLILFFALILLVLGGVVGAFFVFGDQLGITLPFGQQEKEPESITITWWGLWENDQVVKSLIDEYQSQNPYVTIRYVRQSKEDYRERLSNALANGTGPDIMRIHNSWVPMFSESLSPLPPSIMTTSEYTQAYYPVVVSDMTVGSNIVGIPLGFDTIALYVNDEILDTFGKNPPTTWDEMRETAIELTVRNENDIIDQAGVALGRTENVDHWQEILALMMLQNGVDLSNPAGRTAEDALAFYTIFNTVDGVWDETLPNSTFAFASGKVAMYFGPSWRVFEILALNPDLKFRVVPVPQLPKDSANQPDVAYATYWVESVNAESAVAQESWEFLDYLSSKESLSRLYANASQTRLFGEPYPRADMQDLLAGDTIVGAFVEQGDYAQSWYLASRTFDGNTGINTLLSGYFEDAVNALTIDNDQPDDALVPVANGVNQVLSQYGLVQRTAPVQ